MPEGDGSAASLIEASRVFREKFPQHTLSVRIQFSRQAREHTACRIAYLLAGIVGATGLVWAGSRLLKSRRMEDEASPMVVDSPAGDEKGGALADKSSYYYAHKNVSFDWDR